MAPSRALYRLSPYSSLSIRAQLYNHSSYGHIISSRRWLNAAAMSSGPGNPPRKTDTEKKGPLSGIRVLDMTRVLAGPYCTQILGDLGAEIIKIEHPTRGDDTRAWGPPYASYKADSTKSGHGESAYFLGVNRNKHSLALSFQHPEGQKILHSLIEKSDILVENYIPGALAKYNLDYKTLSSINPSLIYASITGYGQTGPFSQRAGYDVMVEAEFGLMHITGERDGPPVKVGVAVTDLTTGLYTANAVMAALIQRSSDPDKRGQWLDVALSDCQTATLANIASSVLVSGKPDTGRWGTAHPSIVPYKGFATADGAIMLGGGNDRLFGVLCSKLDDGTSTSSTDSTSASTASAESDNTNTPSHPSTWPSDPRFKTNGDRVQNRVLLEHLIESITRTKTTAEWLSIFEGSGMPYAAVNDVKSTLEHEHSQARGMVTEIEHGECGIMKLVSPPVKYGGSVVGVRSAPPVLGEHTSWVLGEVLGLSEREVEGLKRDGVVA